VEQKKMEVILISVLMTTLDSARFVEDAVDSILAQTYQPWELIVVDGGSIDGTMDILRKITDSRVHLFECTGLRRSAQLNYAMRKASGEYIAIMDSDDIALPQRLEQQLQFLQMNVSVALVGSWSEYIDENGTVLETNKRPIKHEEIIKKLFNFGHPSLSSIMFRRAILERGDYFNESLQGLEDIEWYLRISSFIKFAIIPEVLMKFRQTQNSLSRTKDKNNERLFINCVNTYFLQEIKEKNSHLSKALWGIAHYYYGDSNIARMLLLQSLISEGLYFQTFRYLIPTLIFPGPLLNSIRGNRFVRNILHGLRSIENKK
jgi:glycosyltransferase involved in cell wall biosynthesis